MSSRAESAELRTPWTRRRKSSGLLARRLASLKVMRLRGIEFEERLIEGLHAVLAGAGGDGVANHARFVGVDDAIADVAGGDHDFDGGNAAGAIGFAHLALADDSFQSAGELQADLFLLGRRKDGDDALNGFGGVESVQVESTRWPVSAARMAVEMVSRSRISPTRTTSGS